MMERQTEKIVSVRKDQSGYILNVRTSGEREIGHEEAIFELEKGTIIDPDHKMDHSFQ